MPTHFRVTGGITAGGMPRGREITTVKKLQFATLTVLCGWGLVLSGCHSLNLAKAQVQGDINMAHTTGADVATGPIVTPGPGEMVTVDQVIVVVDASGSTFPDYKFAFEKEVARAFTSVMPDGYYDSGLMSFGNEWPQDWVNLAATSFDRERMQLGASHLKWLGGSTPLPDALASRAPEMMGYTGKTAVVILSDGMADREKTLDVCTKLLGIHIGPVCFHTVHFGPDTEGRLTLDAVAALTSCGTTRSGGDVASVEGMESFVRDVFFGPGTGTAMVDRSMMVLFDSGKSFIAPGYIPIIDTVAKMLNDEPNARLQIVGYTDNTSSDGFNMGLSQRRVQAVADALKSRGISADRLVVEGQGENNPAQSNDSAEHRALNRRVEMSIMR